MKRKEAIKGKKRVGCGSPDLVVEEAELRTFEIVGCGH